MNRQNIEDWLVEFDIPAAAAQPDSPSGPPTVQPDFADTMNADDQAMPDPNQSNSDQSPVENPTDTPTDDYQEEEPQIEDDIEPSKDEDFEVWKSNFFKESVKGNPNDLIDLISPLREKDTLLPYQRKFIEDNWNIQLIRLNSNVLDASKSIRKNIKDQLDKSNPATSIVNHIANVLDTMPHLNNTFIKMMGYSGNKGELHRKFIAALTGSVQVSSSPDKENIILNEREYSVKIGTRLNSEWGDVVLGSWSLREDDPERYLSEPELKRLSEGIRTARISETLNESEMDSYVYKTQLSGKPDGKQSYVEIVSPPQSIKDGGFITIVSGQVEWELDIRNTRWGLEFGSNIVLLKSIKLNLEMEDEETDEIEEKAIEMPESTINWQKVEVQVGKFPLRLTALVVNMENSEDPSRWRYQVELGDI